MPDSAITTIEVAFNVTRFWLLAAAPNEDGCRLWQGFVDDKGYGVFYFEGRNRGAHVLALTFATGRQCPPGLETCHSCNVRRCVEPAHLRFDSRQSNVDDKVRSGRQARGESHPCARLTERNVIDIREKRAAGASIDALAEEFGLRHPHVSLICTGARWKHAGGPITRTRLSTRKRAPNA